MDPEVVLAVVGAALFGVVVWLVAVPAGWARTRSQERLAYWQLTLPLFAGALVLAFLFGWALQEPKPTDERIGLALYLVGLGTAAVALRAFIRAMQSCRSSTRARIPIGTVGFVNPKVIVSDEFRQAASQEALAAALAHETAHVRARDPLRIWLAQLAADLQWPAPGTARRFSQWLLALEAERDNEAVASGVNEEDLAEAILVAARLHRGRQASACAQAAGGGEDIAWRVRRLLTGELPAPSDRRSSPWTVRATCIALLMVAVWLGIDVGDAVLHALPGVGQ